MTPGPTTWPKPADISQRLHEDVCFACQHIPGLTYDVAVPIIQSVPGWQWAGVEKFLGYVRDISRGLRQKQVSAEQCQRHRSDPAYVSLAARETRRFVVQQRQPETPAMKGPKSGYNRGSGIGDQCWYREMRRAEHPERVRNWKPGWLRQWSTQSADESYIFPVAIVEDAATGECISVWVDDLKFERQ